MSASRYGCIKYSGNMLEGRLCVRERESGVVVVVGTSEVIGPEEEAGGLF